MLNPSTATEVQNDPTVERCERRARALGFGSFAVANIFAFRATDPRVMRADPDPVGPDNDAQHPAIWPRRLTRSSAPGAPMVHHLNRGATGAILAARHRRPLYHLGLTQAGHPKHPLYIGYTQQPVPWP